MSDPRFVELGRKRVELEWRIAEKLQRAMQPVDNDFGNDPHAIAALEEVIAAERELSGVKRKLSAMRRPR
jgi:hypothetical protein